MFDRVRLWLLSHKLRSQHPADRVAAVRGLAELAGPPAADLLAVALGPDQPEEVRAEAAVALGRRGDLRALEPLASAVARGKAGPPVIEALAGLRDPEVTELLLGVLANPHTSVEAKRQAAQGLKAVGARPADPLDRTFYHVANGEYADAAAEPGGIPHLLDLYDEFVADEGFRGEVLAALRAVHDPAAVPDLLDTLRHEDEPVRAAAEAALRNLTGAELDRDAEALTALAAALDLQDPLTRQVAAALMLRAAGATTNPDVRRAGDKAFRILKAFAEEGNRQAATGM